MSNNNNMIVVMNGIIFKSNHGRWNVAGTWYEA